jgi:hypothetical protein
VLRPIFGYFAMAKEFAARFVAVTAVLVG